MKATVVYYSHKGKTARYGREISMHLWQLGVSVNFCSTADFKAEMLNDCDLLILGCWTSGWFVFNQYPHQAWVDFASTLPVKLPEHLVLFTTYKFRTGSMFKNMRRHLSLANVKEQAVLQSQVGLLSKDDKKILDDMVRSIKQSKARTSEVKA